MANPSDYLTPGEFAGLPADAQHAIWKAADAGRLDWVPWTPSGPFRLYHREQVQALLAEARAT